MNVTETKIVIPENKNTIDNKTYCFDFSQDSQNELLLCKSSRGKCTHLNDSLYLSFSSIINTLCKFMRTEK